MANAGRDPLTMDDLIALRKALQEERIHPCRLGQHVLSPEALKRGHGVCGNCAGYITVVPKTNKEP